MNNARAGKQKQVYNGMPAFLKKELPMTLEERGYTAKLTKNEKLIYEFILRNKDKACFMTSTAIARELGVGDTSVIRLSRTLGFSNFTEFRKAIQEEALTSGNLSGISHVPYEKKQKADAIELTEIPSLVRQNFMQKAELDFANNKDGKYHETAEMIVSAEKKYIAGFRNTAGLADYFATILSHVLPNVRRVNHKDGFEDEAIDMGEKDILILFSLPRYSKNASIVLEIAREARCCIVVLTDKITAPITEGAAKVIVNDIESVSFANSISGMVLSMEILISLISKISGQKGRERLKTLDKYMSKTGLY